MKNTSTSTDLSYKYNKSLSGWDRAILEAKLRISALKQSIRTFQDLRDSGMEFPEPTSESDSRHLGQEGVLGQSRNPGYQIHNCILPYHCQVLRIGLHKNQNPTHGSEWIVQIFSTRSEDLNNPLTAVSGICKTLGSEPRCP
jgi:hypothetical protein